MECPGWTLLPRSLTECGPRHCCMVSKQGCPLSPILLNIVLEGLLRHLSTSQAGLTPRSINALAYADDVCIAASSKEEAQDLLDRCAAFGEWAGLRFNVRKCGSLCMVNQAPRIYDDCLFTPHLGAEVTPALTAFDRRVSQKAFGFAAVRKGERENNALLPLRKSKEHVMVVQKKELYSDRVEDVKDTSLNCNGSEEGQKIEGGAVGGFHQKAMLDDDGTLEPRVPDITMEEMKRLQEQDISLTRAREVAESDKKDKTQERLKAMSDLVKENLENLEKSQEKQTGEAGLTVKVDKCQFGMKQCVYLGHVVGNGMIQPEVSKVEAVQSFAKLETKTQIGEEGEEQPVGYYSRKVQPREEHYSTVEKECLAIKSCLCPTKPSLVNWSEEIAKFLTAVNRFGLRQTALIVQATGTRSTSQVASFKSRYKAKHPIWATYQPSSRLATKAPQSPLPRGEAHRALVFDLPQWKKTLPSPPQNTPPSNNLLPPSLCTQATLQMADHLGRRVGGENHKSAIRHPNDLGKCNCGGQWPQRRGPTKLGGPESTRDRMAIQSNQPNSNGLLHCSNTQGDWRVKHKGARGWSPLLQNTPDPEQDRGWMDSQNSGKGKLPLGKRGTNKGQNQLPSTGWAKALNKKVKDLIKANLKLPKYEIHIYRVSTAYRLLLVLSNDPVVRDTALSALGDTAKWKSWWPPSTCHQGLSPSLAGSLDHSRSTSLQGYEVSPPHSTSDEMEECQGPRQDSPMCVRTPSQQPLDPWGKIYLFQRVTVCAQYANLLPTRMVRKRSSEPIQDTSCPKCHEEQETLAHVINHSPPHVCLVRATHNNILHRLAKAVPTSKRSLHTYFSNRKVMKACEYGTHPCNGASTKADLQTAFRVLRRWLKASGVSIPCEEKMRQIARGLLGENLRRGSSPTFIPPKLWWGGDTIRGAPLVFMPDLNQKVIQMLDNDHRYIYVSKGDVYMHILIVLDGLPGIPASYPKLKSTDSVTNLHSALDHYRDQVKQLQGMKWRKCYPLRSLERIQESHKQFVAGGGKRKKKRKNYMNYVTEPIFYIPINQVCLPGLHITQGIFVKISDLLEDACHQLDLQLAYTYTEESSSSSFTKQQYFGGTFVGNHIHKALKPSNIECLCSCMVEVAKAKCPALVAFATREQTRFRRSLSLLGQCHQIYDQNYIYESQSNELETLMAHFMEDFRSSFPDSTDHKRHTTQYPTRFNNWC
eukprot:Em0007g1255a